MKVGAKSDKDGEKRETVDGTLLTKFTCKGSPVCEWSDAQAESKGIKLIPYEAFTTDPGEETDKTEVRQICYTPKDQKSK